MTPIPQNEASFTLAEVLEATGGRCIGGSLEQAVGGVTTDSRLCGGGKLFVALVGDRFDGHGFVAQALSCGAGALLVERPVPGDGRATILVDSTLRALGQLAAFHRGRWEGQLVAIAGSAGKTTTRSTVAQVLACLHPGQVHATPGNLNNQVGVPMVLLALTAAHRYAVVELGTNQPGEVAILTKMARPDYAILTLIELEHTEGLSDLDGVEREETDLLAMSRCDVLGNGDDPRVDRALTRLASDAPSRVGWRYGFGPRCEYRITGFALHTDGSGTLTVNTPTRTLSFTTPYVGRPGALASVAALATAERVLGRQVDATTLEQALVAPQDAMRLTVHRFGRLVVIDDCYNANPASMRAALETAAALAQESSARLVLVLGEMRELGELADAEHKKIAPQVAALSPALVVAVGGHARSYVAGVSSDARFEETADGACARVLLECRAGDVVLVKGSRGVALEGVVRALAANKDSYK